MQILLFLLLVLLPTAAQSQGMPPEVPMLSFTMRDTIGNRMWNPTIYPDGRIWASVRSADDPMIIQVPVFIRNCWNANGISSVVTFPIRSFSIPIQFDSSAVEIVDIDTTGHAENFEYTWSTSPDTTYMRVVNAPSNIRSRGMRIVVKGQVVTAADSLPPTGEPSKFKPCDQYPFLRLFTLHVRIKPGIAADPERPRTALVITNDSLSYNGISVFDSVWAGNPFRTTGLGGIDNHYLDANVQEQVRDPLRPSRAGMIWIESTSNTAALTVLNDAGTSTIDTVTIRIANTHTWADTLDGKGYVDVIVSNSVVRTRASSIAATTAEPWMRFRSDPFPKPVRSGVIPYLDNGLLGSKDVPTAMGDPTTAQPPLRLRIFGNNTMSAKSGRFVGAISFTSTTMRPERVDLPVVLIISDTTTSVDDQGASSSWNVGSITIAPNPSSGSVTISTSTAASNATLELVASDGRIVERFAIENSQAVILTGTLASGVYRAVLRTAGGVTSAPFIVTP